MKNTLEKNKSVELSTVRLLLRRLSINDAEEMFTNWASDPIVSEFMSWGFHKDISETKEHIQDVEKRYKSNPLYFNWGIILKKRRVGWKYYR